MYKNYFKTALRFLQKNKAYSFINIVGLSIGTLCCLYILLYVKDQYSYDKHHRDGNNIYRLNSYLKIGGDIHNNATASPPIAPAIKREFGEVVEFTRFVTSIGLKQHLLRYKEKSFYEKDAVYVDSTFFNVFTYHFIYGNPSTVLKQPYDIVLEKETSEKLFGKEDPVGKVIEISNLYGKHDFKVTGVVDRSLGKTHIIGNIFITMNSGGIGGYAYTNNSWGGSNFTYSYLKLRTDATPAALEKKFPGLLKEHGVAELKNLGMQKILTLQPLSTIHTTPGYEVELTKTTSPFFLYLLILIAVLIQVIACINFMNLATARASKRAKEVGVRKVVGAGKADLITQFLSESFLLSFIGVLFALPLFALALPYLNGITQTNIQFSMLADPKLWAALLGLILITGLVAGSYPAFYLSAFRAIKVIKGNFTNHISAAGIRRALVVFQFVLSIVLIIGIIVIYSQLNYMKNLDLGFEKNQRLIFTFYTEESQAKMGAFMGDLRQLSEVKAVSKSNNYLSQFVFNDRGWYLEGGDMTHSIDARNMMVDENFLPANGIKLVSGRDFRKTDSAKILINESLAKNLGLKPETAPGTMVYSQYAPSPVDAFQIIGVMKDFNFSSLHDQVTPFALMYDKDGRFLSNVTVALNSNNYKTLLSKIEKIWQNDVSIAPFEFSFLDQEVQKQYDTEITLSNIINVFTLMAIFISCLGLFGLAAFSAEQRNKEIGVRKVLGASVFNITQLLSKDFLKLVIISILISIPIAWWAMNKWLDAFAYKVGVQWWMFALAGLLAICIALFTVSFQAIKAAVANPVKSLRT